MVWFQFFKLQGASRATDFEQNEPKTEKPKKLKRISHRLEYPAFENKHYCPIHTLKDVIIVVVFQAVLF
jgi:hypothetical protein